MKYSITKSKSGHYTVTARAGTEVVLRETKLPHLQAAQAIVAKHKESTNVRQD